MASPPAEPLRICEFVSSIKFVPAKDANGQPLYGVVTAQFRWTPDGAEEKTISPDVDLTVAHLPNGATIHPIVKTAVLVGSDGKVEGCSVAETSGVQALDNVACKAGLAAEALQPAKDKTGVHVRALQSLSVGFGAYAQVVLQKNSAYAALGAAGPYFPERAQRLNVSGSVIIECAADAGGALTDCAIKEEIPEGFGFGQAAQKMARTKWMKAAPGSGNRVVIQIEFPASGNFRAP
jgi:TonB family protein